jgi:hypothetical protein
MNLVYILDHDQSCPYQLDGTVNRIRWFFPTPTKENWKMKRSNVFRVAVAIVMVVGLLITTSAMAVDKGAQETIQGMVEKGEKGITMIKTDDGHAITILNKNMSAMIGKKVKITGTLTKGAKNQSIIVTSFEEVMD